MDNYEDFMSQIAGLPPEQRQQIFAQLQQQQQSEQNPQFGLPGQVRQQQIDAGNPDAFLDYEGQGDIIADEQALAEQLRNTAMPKGIQTEHAGFVASNPLSHIATGVKQWQGREAAKEALAKKVSLSDLKSKTQQSVAEKALLSQQEAEAKRQQMIDMQNSRGGSPMQTMANNQYELGSA